MIKESTLIGTKVPAPWGWHEFKVGDLFDIMSTHALNYDLLQPNGTYPYVVRSAQNNGIREFMNYDTAFLNEGNVITLGIDTASYFYQASDFFAGVKVKSLRLKHYELNSRLAMFLIPLLQKQAGGYGYAGGKAFKTAELAEVLIDLPVTQDGQPDYGWMSSYIRELENQHIHELENQRILELETYLQVTGLSDTILSVEEKAVLDKWRQHEKFGGGTLLTKRFLVADLFDVMLSMGDNKIADLPSGNIPLITSGSSNNGIAGYVSHGVYNSQLFDKNLLTADMFGNVLFQPTEFYAVSHGRVNILKPVYDSMNKYVLQFIASVIKKQTVGYYGFDFMLSSKRLNALIIELPVTNDGTPDYDFMQTFIRVQEKLVIQRLGEFRQLQIDTTKAVI